MAAQPTAVSGAVTPSAVVAACSRYMTGPIVWGRSDCCTATGAAFRDLWGVTLPGGHHGYTRARDALRDGLNLWDAAVAMARTSGLTETDEHPGALGLVESGRDEFGGVVPALCIEPGRWAARADGGFLVMPQSLKIWGVAWRA